MRLLRTGRWITVIALALMAGVFVRALAFTPIERMQGPAQKIFYVHVPAAWCAMLAMVLVGIAGILFLLLKDPRFDRFGEASAEVGTVFSMIMLTTGPIWAKPIWGTWWTWDARLTLTLFLFLLFLGYLVLRGAVTDPGLRARYSAVLGICGLVLVPFIHLSVYLFRTLHPQPIVLKPSAPSLPGPMLTTLLVSFTVFTVLYVGFVMQRYALGLLREQAEAGEMGEGGRHA
jgi:heme exporter protein C